MSAALLHSAKRWRLAFGASCAGHRIRIAASRAIISPLRMLDCQGQREVRKAARWADLSPMPS